MHYASPELSITPPAVRIRTVDPVISRRIEAELHRLLDRPGVVHGRVRNALVMGLLHPLHRSFVQPQRGAVRFGVRPGPHRLLRLHGVRLLLPSVGGSLDPGQVTLTHRSAFGGVVVASGVPFGGVELEASALAHGLCPDLLRELVGRARQAARREGTVDWLTPVLLWTAGAG